MPPPVTGGVEVHTQSMSSGISMSVHTKLSSTLLSMMLGPHVSVIFLTTFSSNEIPWQDLFPLQSISTVGAEKLAPLGRFERYFIARAPRKRRFDCWPRERTMKHAHKF